MPGRNSPRTPLNRFSSATCGCLPASPTWSARAELGNVEKPHELVHVFRPEGGWEQAKEPLHERRERNNMVIGAGLGLPFAKEMVRRTNVPVGLIPTAVGGTSLWLWDPALKTKGRESLYGNMLAQFEASGGMARGMLWYQGESDTRPGARRAVSGALPGICLGHPRGPAPPGPAHLHRTAFALRGHAERSQRRHLERHARGAAASGEDDRECRPRISDRLGARRSDSRRYGRAQDPWCPLRPNVSVATCTAMNAGVPVWNPARVSKG